MSMKTYQLESELILKEETTENTMNDAFSRIKRLGKAFFTFEGGTGFTNNKRIRMVKQMVAYFERKEEYEKCAFLMKVLKEFGVLKFRTSEYI
jgi:hypothetical protein